MKLCILILTFFTWSVQAQTICSVQICNKVSRVSFDISTHIKDSMGKVCFDAILPINESYEGNILDNKSTLMKDLMFSNNFNPTKRSKTYVSRVYECKTIKSV